MDKELNTPVLFLIFNRPDTTKQVFETIRKARPKQLFIAADGPRLNKPGEKEKVQTTREIVSNVDWDCDVKTLFRDKNLGCKIAPCSAIDWFFENVEEGIILEDDCLPDQSFFRFCEELLEKYRDDMRIGQICGFNPLIKSDIQNESYLFSKFGPTWGWASWRRAWNKYDVTILSWDEIKKRNIVSFITDSYLEKKWRIDIFNEIYNNKMDAWDYQWSFAKLINSFLSIIPSKNLIKNIGFGEEATHTKGKIDEKLLTSFEINTIIHPKFVMRNKLYEQMYLSDFVKLSMYTTIKAQVKIMINKIKNFIKKRRRWNRIIDKHTKTITFDAIAYANKRKINVFKKDIVKWLEKGGLLEFSKDKLHKKGLEFFFSFYLLDINKNLSVLDAAGGRSNYLKAIKANANINELYLTDHIYEGINQLDDGINIVGGDISSIHLKDSCIDRIACHHAFEHFQGQKDFLFINETYRILKDNGILVIIPLFLTRDHIECWNIPTKKHFDRNSVVVVDKTASIPGADDDGHFARFYNNESIVARIIRPAAELGFKCEIIECEIDGQSIPDMESNFGSLINKPMRALKLTKKVKDG